MTAVPALAAASLTLAQSDEATVRLGGLPVIAVGATADESASERAARMERRLERLADRPADGVSPIVARGADGTRIVSVLDVPLVTVTQADAEEQVTTVDALAADVRRARSSLRRKSLMRGSACCLLVCVRAGTWVAHLVRLRHAVTYPDAVHPQRNAQSRRTELGVVGQRPRRRFPDSEPAIRRVLASGDR